jgi:hypothetical protein
MSDDDAGKRWILELHGMLSPLEAGFNSAAFEKELQSGYGLLLPANIPKRDPAWRRVDTATGTWADMMVGPGGCGGTTAIEYVQMLSKVLSIGLFLYSA